MGYDDGRSAARERHKQDDDGYDVVISGLGQRGDAYAGAGSHFNVQSVVLKKRHTHQGVDASGIDVDQARLAVPQNCSCIHVEEAHTAVTQDDLVMAAEGEAEDGYDRGGERQKPGEPGIDDRLEAVRLPGGVEGLKCDDRLTRRVDKASDHSLEDGTCRPMR